MDRAHAAIQSKDFRIGVLGLGHVGLPTAVCLAELGWHVVGADDDLDKAARISRGDLPFYEPGLAELLLKHLDSGRFQVAENVPSAIQVSTVLFVCVNTSQREDGSADLSRVDDVASAIARNLNGYKLIVEKSTAPVRTAGQIKRTISRHAKGLHTFDVAVNPEFLREGTAIHDFMHPDRVVVGVESDKAQDLLTRIYEPLLSNANGASRSKSAGKLIVTNLNTAELIKHAANAFLATKVSFINLVSDLCDTTGANVEEVALALGMDPRIGPQFFRAGVGFGGYCLPKDLKSFIHIGEGLGVDMSLLKATEAVNLRRTDRLIGKLEHALWVLKGKTIAIWGLSFKPETDDIREAPSLKIVARLLDSGANIRLYDPRCMNEFKKHFPEVSTRVAYSAGALDAVQNADALIVLTEWAEFKDQDFARIYGCMSQPIVIDGRNCLPVQTLRGLGYEYYGMGL